MARTKNLIMIRVEKQCNWNQEGFERWLKKVESFDGCKSYEKIDLAQTIFRFYRSGYTNLSQCDLIAGTANEFKFLNKWKLIFSPMCIIWHDLYHTLETMY